MLFLFCFGIKPLFFNLPIINWKIINIGKYWWRIIRHSKFKERRLRKRSRLERGCSTSQHWQGQRNLQNIPKILSSYLWLQRAGASWRTHWHGSFWTSPKTMTQWSAVFVFWTAEIYWKKLFHLCSPSLEQTKRMTLQQEIAWTRSCQQCSSSQTSWTSEFSNSIQTSRQALIHSKTLPHQSNCILFSGCSMHNCLWELYGTRRLSIWLMWIS